MWRSFQFDEATDTIDGYIHKVKHVAVLLDYGEPQIFKLFKNTLPSRLYCMLYHINDLRVVVEMVKLLLIKEQRDIRQDSPSPVPSCKLAKTRTKWRKRCHLVK